MKLSSERTSPMKEYTVSFFYYTDLRATWKGIAFDDVRALAKATQHFAIETWSDAPGFRVEITGKEI